MTQHTKGRLTKPDMSRYPDSIGCGYIGTELLPTIIRTQGMGKEENEANADRLCQCWNAFAGTSGDPETLLNNLLTAARHLCDTIGTYNPTIANENLRAALAPFEGKEKRG